jgi:aminopeptidase N
MGFAAGRFEDHVAVRDGLEHRVLHPGFDERELSLLVDKAASAMAFFAEVAGVPYPAERFTQVWFEGTAAQESCDMAILRVSAARAMFEDPTEDWLLVHEISHQWWGNMVTCQTWSEFWLNEGFATFMVGAYKERHFGRAAYDREVCLAQERLGRIRAEGGDRPLVAPPEAEFEEVSGPLSYSKGLLLLHTLRGDVGERAFWEGIRDYTRRGWGKGVTTADLRRSMEHAAGRDLRHLFANWCVR